MPESSETLILDAQPWGALLVDRDHRIRFATRPAAALLDATVEALQDEPLGSACPFDGGADIARDVDAAFGGDGEPATAHVVRLPGHERADAFRVLVRATSHADRVAICIERLLPFGGEPRLDIAIERCLRVASDVRHAVNNSLMGIFGHADLIAMDAGAPERVRERARQVVEEAQKLRDQLAPLQALRRGSL